VRSGSAEQPFLEVSAIGAQAQVGGALENELARSVAVASGHATHQRSNPRFDVSVSHREQCFLNNLQPLTVESHRDYDMPVIYGVLYDSGDLYKDAVFGSECSCRTVVVGLFIRVWCV
jgi:hypothetical protein